MRLFITGTDTEVGKTYVSIRLLTLFNELGLSTLGIKPVASGCRVRENKLYNDDALQLQQASSIKLDYDTINPFAFQAPIAPHIAARQTQCELTLQTLKQKLHPALSYAADVSLLEGCGGWYTPLNHQETMADFVIEQQLPVILVVGMRLGCINHALLTQHALQQSKVQVLGWIANCVDPTMAVCQENITTLQTYLPFPLLGTLAHHSKQGLDAEKIRHYLLRM